MLFQMRVKPEEKAAWMRAAAASGMTLSAWARSRLAVDDPERCKTCERSAVALATSLDGKEAVSLCSHCLLRMAREFIQAETVIASK